MMMMIKYQQLLPIFMVLFLLLNHEMCWAANMLASPSSLTAGEYLENNSYKFVMESDCDLVLYDSDDPIWQSGTAGKGINCYCTMQRDGNFVIYDEDGRTVWSTETASWGEKHYVLVLQRDRNVVIYGPNRWATNTVPPTPTGTDHVPADDHHDHHSATHGYIITRPGSSIAK